MEHGGVDSVFWWIRKVLKSVGEEKSYSTAATTALPVTTSACGEVVIGLTCDHT